MPLETRFPNVFCCAVIGWIEPFVSSRVDILSLWTNPVVCDPEFSPFHFDGLLCALGVGCLCPVVGF